MTFKRDEPAVDTIADQLPAIRSIVFGHIQRAGDAGLTDWELEELVGDHGATYRTRRAELAAGGWVCEVGARANPESGNAIERAVWVAVPEPERPAYAERMKRAAGSRLRDEVRILLEEADRNYESGIVALSTSIASGDIDWCRRLLTTNMATAHAMVKNALTLLSPRSDT